MKRTIRKGLFETNSSSIHCITIGNNGENFYEKLPKKVEFTFGEFGWEHEIYNDTESKASYLYTLIRYNEMGEEYINKIRDILAEWNVESEFADNYEQGWFYVDHGFNAKSLVEKLCNDSRLLMNYLFSEGSVIETGNDNEEIDWSAPQPTNILLEYEKGN